ncbi:MAG TPA: cell division protein FtsQ/DivIB [Paracoccaceae bacterium]|nr:cell division protein FtsQ/DivIB [Paracoccaceae bacterium]
MRSLIRRSATALPRRDPAPSRLAYRLHRLWLTPLFRVAMRVGLPLLLVAMSAGAWLQDDARRAQLTGVFAELREKVKNRPEFAVTLLSVEGATPEVAEAVRAALALPLPASSLDLDLTAARDRVAALDAVREVQLRVQSGGVLRVTVAERDPAVVWRTEEGLTLLDETGHRVADIWARADRADLPLIAGQGAEAAVPEALMLIAGAGPLLPRVRGLVRMGERRWDIVLDRDQRILLPADQPLRALERLIALDSAQGLLARDVLAVDLRLEGRPALRLAPFALTEMRRARGILPPETDL